jgi:hypothetical protein
MTLQAEGLALAAICIAAYAMTTGGWGLLAWLILAPDLFMLGYLAGPRIGALAYNLGHSVLIPAALGVLGYLTGSGLAMQLALIWGAHIGIDRALGYGLKYATGFRDTDLARL